MGSPRQRVVSTPATGMGFLANYQAVGTVPPVTIASVQKAARKGSIRRILVNFSDAVDPASAQDASAYWIVLPGRDRRFGNRDDRRVRIRAASYNSTADTVTLTPKGLLSSRMAMQVVVSGSSTSSGIKDIWGRLIDGDRDGQPGGNAVEILEPRKAKSK